MKELVIDVSRWDTPEDLYLSFFEVVGAPAWHGKNLDAVRDSIGGGSINGVEVPYRLILKNYNVIPRHLKKATDAFVEVIHRLANEGVPIEIRMDS